MILAALLPGLLVGLATPAPMRSAVSWASEKTRLGSAYAADEARAEASLRAYRQAPPPEPSGWPEAPQDLAARMLRPADLGPDWFNGVRPAIFVPPLVVGRAVRLGAAQEARTVLTEQHWTDGDWSLDHMLSAELAAFRTPQEAQRFVASAWEHADDTCGCGPTVGPTTTLSIDGVTVRENTSTMADGDYRHAAFILDRDVFMLDVDDRGHAVGPADFDRMLTAAVRRAVR